MHFTTSITKIENDRETIRGYELTELIKKHTFTEAIFLLLKGKLPTETETKMLNALLTAAIDHGAGAPSAMVARITASTKNSLHTAVAAGVLAMGELHGSAIEGAARFFVEHLEDKDLLGTLTAMKARKERVRGFGHKVLSVDHRSEVLFQIAKETNVYGRYSEFAHVVGEEINKISNKPLPLNIDAAMAAILLDLGFAPEIMKGFFIIARTTGLVAQAYEEMTSGTGVQRLEENEVEFIEQK